MIDIPLMQLTKEGILCRIYNSASDAARITGFSQGNLSECANGSLARPRCGGYFWKYVTN